MVIALKLVPFAKLVLVLIDIVYVLRKHDFAK